jgi:hypothetical protein
MESTAIEAGPVARDAELSLLARAFELLGGPSGVLRALRAEGIEKIKTPWAVNKWLRAGRLPRTEYTGETNYAAALERATKGEITAAALLEEGRQRATEQG